MNNLYNFYTTNEIKPHGWLKRQLQIQADGLFGNLDKMWPDVQDSAWIGGAREGWERVPYWLDGFIPLAYLLEDEDMIGRAKRYVDRIIEGQKEDGWICPSGDTPKSEYDLWAIHLITKVLTVYYECSSDERIPGVLYSTFKNFYNVIRSGEGKIFSWAKFRWYEGFIGLDLVEKHFGKEKWISELASMLKRTGTDYKALKDKWVRPLNKWTLETHVVNLAMMLKSEAVSHDMLAEEYADLAEELYSYIMEYNGCATGIFTGDECLSGISPTRGTELCAVVELMYSFELLYAHTGDSKWAERLEKIAFNALPATISDDMWTHQYVQMANQIECTPFPGKSYFRTNNSEAHLFGLEPNFGCCTANGGQGWPKLALSAYMKAKDGVVAAINLPCSLNTEYNGAKVQITNDSDYPFRNRARYTVTTDTDTDMKLYIRLPSFAKKIRVNSCVYKNDGMIVIEGFNAGETEISIEFEINPKMINRPGALKCIEVGSLLFSLPIKSKWVPVEYEKNGVKREAPYCDYHVVRQSDYNYGFVAREVEVLERPISDIPFAEKNPPVVAKVRMAKIEWELADGYETVPSDTPMAYAIGEVKEMELYPYGCAKLRVTEMPMCKYR